MFVCVFEVFSVTHQCCDNRQGRFAIMFREDSQIDFAKESAILNVSLRPPPSVLSILNPIVSLKCVNQLLKITRKSSALTCTSYTVNH